MPSETSLALPDALVAELVDRIANLAETPERARVMELLLRYDPATVWPTPCP